VRLKYDSLVGLRIIARRWVDVAGDDFRAASAKVPKIAAEN